jgi:hypothetical protein
MDAEQLGFLPSSKKVSTPKEASAGVRSRESDRRWRRRSLVIVLGVFLALGIIAAGVHFFFLSPQVGQTWKQGRGEFKRYLESLAFPIENPQIKLDLHFSCDNRSDTFTVMLLHDIEGRNERVYTHRFGCREIPVQSFFMSLPSAGMYRIAFAKDAGNGQVHILSYKISTPSDLDPVS